MKISEMGNVIVVFIEPQSKEIIHKIVYESYPNIASLMDNFQELNTDEDFGIGEDAQKLIVDILPMDVYISEFGDDDLEEHGIKE